MSHSFFHGWKTRLFHASQSPLVLTRVTISILLGGFLIGCGIVALHDGNTDHKNPVTLVTKRLQERLDGIKSMDKGRERALAGWLQDLKLSSLPTPEDPKVARDMALKIIEQGKWFGFDVKGIVQQEVKEPATQGQFKDYILARGERSDLNTKAARQRLQTAAQSTPAPAFANEFLGDLLEVAGKTSEAMTAFRREGEFPDARRARSKAFHLAVYRKDLPAMREMLALPAYQNVAPGDLHRAGILLADWGLAAISFIRMEKQSLRPLELIFTLLTAGLWYAVFVRFGVRERWRWVRPLPALLAGVASIWPTMILIHWQELHLGQQETGEFLHDLVFYVTGVGLREEAAKLALFALFLPWLLRQRSPGKALLTGAFVGLGFAMDENREYFHREGVAGVAVGRLLTANFFHAAATGLAGHALYELVRTRFGMAERFIATFVGVVVVHGVYDWVLAAGSSLATLGSIAMFSIIILALLAQQFFDRLGDLIRPQRGTISLLGLFLVGVTFLVASGFVLAAAQAGTLAAVSKVGTEAISLVPITVFYARKFVHL
ncbi:MAG: hypothetical protein JWO89_276 [Verrucomicrobiaceae bacterium]|nr:hypothetical protein [Verrucomicrobiaceae bacterium]